MIMSAPNGARRSHTDHPALPLTPKALARDAVQLVEAGVSVLHLHVRDHAGQHSLAPDHYRQAINAIRAEVGENLILQITTEAVGRYSPQEQMSVVETVRPEAVSLALRELLQAPELEPEVLRFFSRLPQQGCWPQFIVYTPTELKLLERLRQRGDLGTDQPSCLLVLGRYSDQLTGTEEELDAFLQQPCLPHYHWSACCFGRTEQSVLLAAVRQGGHVRLGFENNLELPTGEQATNNTALINAFVQALPTDSSPLAQAKDLRAQFLSKTDAT